MAIYPNPITLWSGALVVKLTIDGFARGRQHATVLRAG
jgi:hypothetical protein